MKKHVINYLGLLSVAGTIIALDQWTKYLLRSRLPMGESWPVDGWLLELFKFVHTQNSGAAFSMGRGLGPLFLVLAIVASIAILFYYPRLPSGEPFLRLMVGLILGGAVGNLIDRLTIGQVTDFLAIRFFAVINLADASLSVGAAGVFCWIIWKDYLEKKRSSPLKE